MTDGIPQKLTPSPGELIASFTMEFLQGVEKSGRIVIGPEAAEAVVVYLARYTELMGRLGLAADANLPEALAGRAVASIPLKPVTECDHQAIFKCPDCGLDLIGENRGHPERQSIPTFCYSLCDQHKGMTWYGTGVASYSSVATKLVCPICEPPKYVGG